MVREGMESIIQPRVIDSVVIGGQMQVILVKNTSETHDRSAPKVLVKNLSGTVDYTPAVPSAPAELTASNVLKIKERVAEIDVGAVASIKLLYNTTKKTIDGLCFYGKDIEVGELGRAFLGNRSSISLAASPSSSNTSWLACSPLIWSCSPSSLATKALLQNFCACFVMHANCAFVWSSFI